MAGESPSQPGATEVRLIFIGLVVGLFVAALDQTIVATALPTIVGELGAIEFYSWAITAYLVAATVTVPLYGKIGDLYGRRRIFQVSVAIFVVGSFVAGAAASMSILIVGRGVQGVGAGGLISLTSAIVGDIVSPRERGKYQGILGAVFGVASLVGPLLGGFFTEVLTWRLVFWINVPLGLIAILIIGRYLRLPVRRVEHSVDFVGAVLVAGATGALLLVAVWGGQAFEWASVTIIGLIVLSVLLLVTFVWWEGRVTEPLIPPRLFRVPSVSTPIITSGLFGVAFFGAIIYLPVYLQIVKAKGPTESGLLLLPLVVGIVLSSAGSGLLITKTGRYKAYPVVGLGIVALCLFWLSTLGAETSTWDFSVRVLILGFGLGLILQNLVVALQNAAEPRDLGSATSTNLFFRSMGGSLGTALFGAVLAGSLARRLDGPLGELAQQLGVDIADLTGSPEEIALLPDVLRIPLVDGFTDGLSLIYLIAIPFAVLGLVLMAREKELPLRETTGLEEMSGDSDDISREMES